MGTDFVCVHHGCFLDDDAPDHQSIPKYSTRNNAALSTDGHCEVNGTVFAANGQNASVRVHVRPDLPLLLPVLEPDVGWD